MNDTLDISKLNDELASLVRAAISCGWTARNTQRSGVVLHSPVGNQNISFPAGGQAREAFIRTAARKVFKYGDPVKVAVFGAHVETDNDAVKPMAVPETWTAPPESIPVEDTRPKIEIELEEPRVRTKPTIVSQRAWIAKRGNNRTGARGYESSAAVERTWSDGMVDYACSWPGCEYTNATGLSVARHYGRSADHTKPATPGQTLVIEQYEPTFHHSKTTRIERLTREIEAALRALGTSIPDPDDASGMAKALAEVMIDKRGESVRDDEPREPLTPEQKLERIRVLVDDGSYLRRIEAQAEMQLELEKARQDLITLQDRAETAERNLGTTVTSANEAIAEANTRAKRFKDSLDTLGLLIQEVGNE